MDSGGNIYKDPTPDLVKEKKLRPINRALTGRELKVEKIGRNAPCGCGSGVKFKKCCYGKLWTEIPTPPTNIAREK
jgi:hypothetical protein